MKHTFLIILNSVLILLLAACSGDEVPVPQSPAIQFSFEIEPPAGTRATGKDYFYDGDRIYISATFTINGGNDIRLTEMATVVNGRIPTTMKWPENATAGSFTAWFAGNSLPDENGILATDPFNDLLKATISVNAPEDHIQLNFRHSLIRIVISGILKDETLSLSSPSGSDGIVSFDTNLPSDDSPFTCGNGISLTLTAGKNTFYLYQWGQPLTLHSDKVTEDQTIGCPTGIAEGKSYHIIFRQ